MKKTILAMALLVGLSYNGVAQESKQGSGKHPKNNRKEMDASERAKQGANWAEKKLGLNADQKAKWEVAAKERLESNMAIREKLKGSTTPEERKKLHSEAKANNDKFNTTVSGFLTADQKTKFDKMKTEKQEAHKMKMKGKKLEDEKELPDEIEGN